MSLSSKNHYYKLVFVCHEFPPIGGGAATALQNLCKTLATQGHNITILTIGPSKPVKYKKIPNLSIIPLGNVRKNSLCPSFIEFLKSYFFLKFKTPSYIDFLKPDVVISFFAFPTGRAIWSYLKKHNIPHIVSIRGVDAPGFYEERYGGLAQYVIPRLIKPVLYAASAVYGNGKRLKKLVEGHFKDIEVFNIPNGVTFDAPLNIQKKDFSIYKLIFVGQLIERKRIKEALEGVISFARSTHKTIEFTIVGTGGLESTLKKIADVIPPNLTVLFRGYMDREELSHLYNQQHVMIHFSQDEGVSNTLLEAFSKGLAILASESAAYEFCKNIQFPGRILPSFSPEVVRDSIADMFSDLEELNQNFSRSIDIAKEFSWEENAQKVLELIEKVLKTKEL
ncbi:MAG: glycosyl transferase, group 1 [Alphaproteobacteria bacterium]|jgi:glycosyltransferase involved in cell wall biosynthesis|nr:glycosyl transferase, group 1 [Alphaproteobacteria bacterium]